MSDERVIEYADIKIKLKASLQPYNTLSIPATAAYLVRCTTLEQLIQSIDFAEQEALDILVLGEGSNTVLSKDFDGLLILIRLTGIEQLSEDPDSITVKVAAGENWHEFVKYSLKQNWYGLENLALIPGLVGAAPIQNIGAYGVEVGTMIEAVYTIDLKSKREHVFTQDQCQFAYRDSIFKQDNYRNLVITAVSFRLSKQEQPNLSYPSLAQHFAHTPCARELFDAVCEIRASKLPMPDDIPNAGSFFKNPIIDQLKYQQLKQRYPSIVGFPLDNGEIKLAAAWMIEHRGWKEKSLRGVYVHRDQSLVVINPNHKTGDAVLNFAAAIQQDIDEAFGVSLEIEPRIY